MPWRMFFEPRQHDTSRAFPHKRPTKASKPGGGEGEQHPEQKTGFKPPLPFEDDGFQVDMTVLQDLVDSGEKEKYSNSSSTTVM